MHIVILISFFLLSELLFVLMGQSALQQCRETTRQRSHQAASPEDSGI